MTQIVQAEKAATKEYVNKVVRNQLIAQATKHRANLTSASRLQTPAGEGLGPKEKREASTATTQSTPTGPHEEEPRAVVSVYLSYSSIANRSLLSLLLPDYSHEGFCLDCHLFPNSLSNSS
ncbi:MAG: hypothetical protein GVY02_02210 [Bacteroidetes bacterium]|nr:hypothetical protein [Bacteroidota bacterium]